MTKPHLGLNLSVSLYRTDFVKISAGYSAHLHKKNFNMVFNQEELETRRKDILSNPLYQEKMDDCWNQVVDSAVSPIYDQIYKQGFSDQFDENAQGLRTAGSINGYGLGLHEGLDLARTAVREQLPLYPYNPIIDEIRVSILNKITASDRLVRFAIDQRHLLEGQGPIPRLIPRAYEIDGALERVCKFVDLTDQDYREFKNQFLNQQIQIPTTFKETFADSVIAFQETQLNPRDSQIEVIHSIGGTVDFSLSPLLSRLKPLQPLFNNVDFGFTTSLHKELNSDSFLKFKNGWNANFSLQFKTRQAVSLKVQEKDICQIDLSYEIRPSSSSNIRVDCLFNSLFTQSKSEVKSQKQKKENREFQQQQNQALPTSNFASISSSNFYQQPVFQNGKTYHVAEIKSPYQYESQTNLGKITGITWVHLLFLGAVVAAFSLFKQLFQKTRKNKKITKKEI